MQEQETVDFRALRERYSQGKKAYEEAMAARNHMPGGRRSNSRRLDQLDDVALEEVPEELSLVCALFNHLHIITDTLLHHVSYKRLKSMFSHVLVCWKIPFLCNQKRRFLCSRPAC
jgi:hypothetical protein